MRILPFFVLAVVLAGCALQPDYVEVRPQPPALSSDLSSASRASFSIQTRDNRHVRDRVSNKVNGYGMDMAPIIATNDVLADTRRVISDALERRGFGTSSTDGTMEIEFTRVFARFVVGFWSGTAAAEATANVTVTSRAGAIVFTRSFRGEANNPDILLATGENARIALDQALSRLVEQIVNDRDLVRALQGLAPREPARRGAPAA